MVEIARVTEIDPGGTDLRGLRVTWGGFYDANEFGAIGGGLYLTGKEGRGQRVWDAGIQLSMPYLGSKWFGLGPRFKLGLETRDQPPDDGLGAVASLGVEVGIWAGDRLQFMAFVDREVGMLSGTRNQVGFGAKVAVPGFRGRN